MVTRRLLCRSRVVTLHVSELLSHDCGLSHVRAKPSINNDKKSARAHYNIPEQIRQTLNCTTWSDSDITAIWTLQSGDLFSLLFTVLTETCTALTFQSLPELANSWKPEQIHANDSFLSFCLNFYSIWQKYFCSYFRSLSATHTQTT